MYPVRILSLFYMNSFRSSYAGSITRPLFGPPLKVCPDNGTPKDTVIFADLYRYQKLYNLVINQMTDYLTLFTNGEFTKLREVFTDSKFRSILATNLDTNYTPTAEELKKVKYNPNLFGYYRKNAYSVLNGFSLAVKQNETLENVTRELNEKKELLASKDKLIEYIQRELADVMMIDTFHLSQPYQTQAILKPWFMRYLELYGAPYDGVFDAEKMATVVQLLIQENVITMDQFLQNQA